MIRVVSILILCLLTLATGLAKSPQRFLTGNPEDVAKTGTSGGYALMGGGGDVDDAFRWLLKKADGGDVVVLRASGSDGYNDYLFSELGVAVDSVETLVFKNRRQAFDTETAETIAGAELIFLAGGDQSKYVRFWKGTPVEDLIHQHARNNKPIGGSSAGLAVLGHVSYSAMRKGNLTSRLALLHPDHEYLTLERDFLKLPGLEGVLTDSHFSERDRMGRLLVMLRKQALEIPSPPVIGIGIDEATALCLEPNGKVRVMSSHNGAAYFVSINQYSPETLEGTRATAARLPALSESVPFTVEALANAGETIHLQILNAHVKQLSPAPND